MISSRERVMLAGELSVAASWLSETSVVAASRWASGRVVCAFRMLFSFAVRVLLASITKTFLRVCDVTLQHKQTLRAVGNVDDFC